MESLGTRCKGVGRGLQCPLSSYPAALALCPLFLALISVPDRFAQAGLNSGPQSAAWEEGEGHVLMRLGPGDTQWTPPVGVSASSWEPRFPVLP